MTGGKITFVTLHDTGCNHRSFVPFIESSFMDRVRQRARFVHVVMPGHDDGEPLWQGDNYPTCDEIAHDINDVLDALGHATCICMGEGAGANILARFTLQYPNRCLGLISIDLLAAHAGLSAQLWSGVEQLGVNRAKWIEKAKSMRSAKLGKYAQLGGGAQGSRGILAQNMLKYEMMYLQRSALQDLLGDGLSSEVLLISGQYSSNVKEVRRVLRFMDKTHTTFMQFDKTNDILGERHEQLARALVLFSKSCGVLLGVPMFGLEDAYDKVAMKANRSEECKPDVVRQIARQMISHERRLAAYLDGEHEIVYT